MQLHDEYKLDNPAWYSLQETHKRFAIGNDDIKRYQKQIVSFVAYDTIKENGLRGLDKWTDNDESFFIIGDLKDLPPDYNIESSLDCLQMICAGKINMEEPAPIIQELTEKDEEQMIRLVNKVQPGYFLRGTRLMGDYYGILQKNELVAMAGERMRMNKFTEISAVVTDPNFTGRKYARHLITHLANKNITAGVIPYLHTGVTNERAIKIYEHLGFITRRIIPFRKIKRVN
jgi:GNAT superfamily N-acetyltransferase